MQRLFADFLIEQICRHRMPDEPALKKYLAQSDKVYV
jgi:hypothetical protein